MKTGFTTGACAAAAAKAAWLAMRGTNNGDSSQVSIRLPDGAGIAIPVEAIEQDGSSILAKVRKYAGDDPDVTDGAVISAKISLIPVSDSAKDPRDHIEQTAAATIVIAAGEGVGLVTRKGLKVPPGKWAINPTPRKMIAENIADTGIAPPGNSAVRIEISLENGAEIAEKTLNPNLGVVGGVSILGTTGVVTPHSHAAYAETIRLMVAKARDDGASSVCFCTGAATEKAAGKRFPDIPENSFVRIADFIGDAIDAAAKAGLESVKVACMPGKLFKYALGFKNTHAAKVRAEMESLAGFMECANINSTENIAALDAPTVRGVLGALDGKDAEALINVLGVAAVGQLASWAPSLMVSIACFDFDAETVLGEWTNNENNIR